MPQHMVCIQQGAVGRNCIVNTFDVQLVVHQASDVLPVVHPVVLAVVTAIAKVMLRHSKSRLYLSFAMLSSECKPITKAAVILLDGIWQRPEEYKYASFDLGSIDGEHRLMQVLAAAVPGTRC